MRTDLLRSLSCGRAEARLPARFAELRGRRRRHGDACCGASAATGSTSATRYRELDPSRSIQQSRTAASGDRLMNAVIERSDARGFPGVRLVQAAYHARPVSLYTKLGFASREEIAVMDGDAADSNLAGYTVRPLSPDDLRACNEICTEVHGFDRGAELAAAGDGERGIRGRARRRNTRVHLGPGLLRSLCRRDGRRYLRAAVDVPRLPSLGVLVPIRNYRLFRWCLDHGMRVLMTMTLMSRGLYQEPSGPYLPSILY